MSRLDWKKGRFDTRTEVAEVENALRGFQGSQIEDSVDYFRFDRSASAVDDVFDEGFGMGLVFQPSVDLPVLHATHTEGGQGNGENNSGFYFGDTIYVTTTYDLFSRTGLTQADVHHERYIKDRIVYDGLVFRVQSINILGQVDRRDTIVSFEGSQVKPDELSNDPQFAQYATQPFPNTP
jgi:hypothetical protein